MHRPAQTAIDATIWVLGRPLPLFSLSRSLLPSFSFSVAFIDFTSNASREVNTDFYVLTQAAETRVFKV